MPRRQHPCSHVTTSVLKGKETHARIRTPAEEGAGSCGPALSAHRDDSDTRCEVRDDLPFAAHGDGCEGGSVIKPQGAR